MFVSNKVSRFPLTYAITFCFLSCKQLSAIEILHILPIPNNIYYPKSYMGIMYDDKG